MRGMSFCPIALQHGHSFLAVISHEQMNRMIGSKQNFPRQPDITGIIFDQENFYWHALSFECANSAWLLTGEGRQPPSKRFRMRFDCDVPSNKVNNHA